MDAKWRFLHKGGEKVFYSQYKHSLDPKGRVIMPMKYREELGEEFIITQGFDHSLYVFPMPAWEEFSAKIMALSLANKNARKLSKHFIAGATDCQMDKQGRVLIPQYLRDFAGIEGEVTIAGAGDKLEITAASTWEAFREEIDADAVADALNEEDIIL